MADSQNPAESGGDSKKSKSGNTTKSTKGAKNTKEKKGKGKNNNTTAATPTSNTDEMLSLILKNELANLDGIQTQNPENGKGINSGKIYIGRYTNRIFGSPFQLIDSVDERFKGVNTHLGSEYLRNFILNSPILHISPGLPKYTGGATATELVQSIKDVYIGVNNGFDFSQALLEELASDTIFSSGAKLQKRMFGFRETYWQYMSYVNYMCRSMANFLNLTTGVKYPTGCKVNGKHGLKPFAKMDWQNYRMLTGVEADKPFKQLSDVGKSTMLGATVTSAVEAVKAGYKEMKGAVGATAAALAETMSGSGDWWSDMQSVLESAANNFSQAAEDAGEEIAEQTEENYEFARNTSVVDIMADKVNAVLFMVEPVQFEENLTNSAEPSIIEQSLDAVNSNIGQELAFITGSDVDLGMLEGVTDFLGDTVQTATNFIQGLVKPIAGGFTQNLFNGAVSSIKGQKMIYPKIYKSSNSEMSYQFTINLSSPYGDVYNYYMNIVVPLMHLIALTAPRMVTSNSITSPFLVQAYIPGMCTCQLGIISNMQIVKNPSAKHVSVNGFPLDIKVTFTIEELYNSLSISPANDPASFLFNETLNDYMANLAGLMPSLDTYTRQRKAMFGGLETYFEKGEWKQDLSNRTLTKVEDFVNPFAVY